MNGIGSWLKITGLLLAGCMQAAHADVAVVVNPGSPIASLGAKEVADLYLAKASRTSEGIKLIPLDQTESSEVWRQFYERVVQKSPAQLNAYWSRLIFTGKGRPPLVVADSAEVLELVAANPNMMGYLPAEAVTDAVKVVLVLP